MKYSIQIAIVIGCVFLTFSCVAQKGTSSYEMPDGSMINAGDTVVFTGGSLGGQYVHVFYMVGDIPKRRATFSDGFYSELIIDRFIEKKEDGERNVFAVLGLPNKSKWFVWVRLIEAIESKEVKLL